MKLDKRKILWSALVIVVFCTVIISTALLICKFYNGNPLGKEIPNDNEIINVPDTETGDDTSGENETPNNDNEDVSEPVIVVSETDKALLLIANADDEIYSKFEYFIDSNGKIITEHITNTDFYPQLETLCKSLNEAVNTRVSASVNKITNEMYSTYSEIESAVNDIRNLFLYNAKF